MTRTTAPIERPRTGPARGVPLALALAALVALVAPASHAAAQGDDAIAVLDLRSRAIACFPACPRASAARPTARLLEDLDWITFAVSVQGLVNRDGPRLYVIASDVDAFWLDRALEAGQPWGWAAGRRRVDLDGPEALLDAFGPSLRGTVRWTADVPAGLDVATTAAGVEGLAIVREGSAIEPLVTARLPVALDLVGRFSNKREAAAYARAEFLPRCRPGLLGYLLDGWTWRQVAADAPYGSPRVFARDFLVAERGFVFDLSPWADEAPNDDPGQPIGEDRREFEAILDASRRALGGAAVTSVWGFYPWEDKYTVGSRLHAASPVLGEWETSALLSRFDARVTGGGGQAYGVELANASFHRWGRFPRHMPRHRTPTPSELAELGYLNQHLENADFEWGSPGPWVLETRDRAIVADASLARRGTHLLEVVAGAAGESIRQDVARPVTAGHRWRLRAAFRARSLPARARVVLWGIGGPGPDEAAVIDVAPTDTEWHDVEGVLVASGAHAALRVQVYVDTPGVNVDVDAFRLARIEPFDPTVANRTFVLFHLGDYDAGAGIHSIPLGVYPRVWTERDAAQIPVAWGFAPDTIEYLPGIMAYYAATAGPFDHFAAPDSGAGYVNPGFMSDAGAALFVEASRRAMGRLGESVLAFFLNGNAGLPSPSVALRWNRVGPDGVIVNDRQLGDPTPRSIAGTPWIENELEWSFAGISDEAATANVDRAYSRRFPGVAPGSQPRFLAGRSVFTGPALARRMLDGAIAAHPERDYTAVDPFTFGYLLRRSLLGTNESRASWIDDDLPRAPLAGSTASGTVRIRNDGWEVWGARVCQLGVLVSDDPDALPSRVRTGPVFVDVPGPVGPGESVSVRVSLPIPEVPGPRTLSYDLRCGTRWLDDAGNIPYRDTLDVVDPATLDAGVPDGGPEDAGGSATDAASLDGGRADAGREAPVVGGCACRAGARRSTPSPLLLVLAGLAARALRRRRAG